MNGQMMGNPYQNFLTQTTNPNLAQQQQQVGQYQQGYPQYQQGYPQQQNNQFQSQNPVLNMQQQQIVEVNGVQGANNYRIAANSSIIMMDSKEPIVYIQETDSGGYPTVSMYRLMPMESNQPQQPNMQNNDYEYRLRRLEEELEAMKNESIIEDESRQLPSATSEPTTTTRNGNKSRTTTSNK